MGWGPICKYLNKSCYSGFMQAVFCRAPSLFLCLSVCACGVCVISWISVFILFSVVIPPGLPELLHLQDFPHCQKCIKALPNTHVTVTCKSEGGSPPLVMGIFKDGGQKKTSTFQGSFATLAYSFTATEDFEWATMTCNISNAATMTPLSTKAKVYLYRKNILLVWNVRMLHINSLQG